MRSIRTDAPAARRFSRGAFLRGAGAAAVAAAVGGFARSARAQTATREVTVDPSWSSDDIRTAIAQCDVVKFAPGEYHITPLDAFTGFYVNHSVKLMAADANNKPWIIVDTGGDINPFSVIAPGCDVAMENLKFYCSGGWSGNVVTCRSFDMRGCEPVPADPSKGRMAEILMVCFAYYGAPCEINQITLIGNKFVGNGHVIEILPDRFGGPQTPPAVFIHKNICICTTGFLIENYSSLIMTENVFVVTGYLLDFVAAAFVIASDDPASTAIVVNNRVHMDLPAPVEIPWWPGVMQFVFPGTIGCPYHDVPAYNVMVNNLTIDGGCPIARAMQTFKANGCIIKNVDYSGANIMGQGARYDFSGDALLAWFITGSSDLFAVGIIDAAEYLCLNTASLTLMDNKKPGARVLEWPTTGNVTYVGKMRRVSRYNAVALPQGRLDAAAAALKARHPQFSKRGLL